MLDNQRVRYILDRVPRSSQLFDPFGIGSVDSGRYWDIFLSPDVLSQVAYTYIDLGVPIPHDCAEPWMTRLFDSNLRQEDPDIWQLEGLFKNRSLYVTLLRAYLLAGIMEFKELAERMKMPLSFVCGFHELFFNVRGRLDEPMFINRLLYPHGRQPEFRSDYLANADWEQVLLRRVCHRDLDAFHYLVGAHRRPKAHSIEEALEQVEGMLMDNAIVAGEHLGGMQQRSNVGFNNAKNLLSSSKIGGGGSSGMDTDPLLGGTDIADRIKEELFRV